MREKWLARSTATLLLFQMTLVITGGLVRLTGSGLGCPTWPKCTADSYRPVESQPQLHAWIEFGNRLLTFGLFFASVAALYFVYQTKRSDLKLLAWLQVGGIFGQGILGGITVLTKLNPATVAGHLLLSMLLIAGATTLNFKIKPYELQSDNPLARLLAVVAFITLIAGTVVTGSGPHAGDWQAPRFKLAIYTAAKIHSAFVAITLILAIFLAIKYSRIEIRALLLVILGQALIGLLQWWQGLPQWLVALHLLGASLFWFATWRTRLSFKYRRIPRSR